MPQSEITKDEDGDLPHGLGRTTRASSSGRLGGGSDGSDCTTTTRRIGVALRPREAAQDVRERATTHLQHAHPTGKERQSTLN